MTVSPKKQGFTLVELSIVLVIIGLLIGGVLAAKSMISTTKIQRIARQIGQYDAAVSNFKTKYNSLPGDSRQFANQGNDDGAISGTQYGYPDEFQHAWEHLSIGVGLKNQAGGDFEAMPIRDDAQKVNEKHCPTLNVDKENSLYSCLIIMTSASPIYGFIGGNVPVAMFMYRQFDAENAPDTYTTKGVLKAADAFALDSKLDDGVPSTGNVISDESGYLNDGHCVNGIGASYKLDEDVYACDMYFLFGTFTGQAG